MKHNLYESGKSEAVDNKVEMALFEHAGNNEISCLMTVIISGKKLITNL